MYDVQAAAVALSISYASCDSGEASGTNAFILSCLNSVTLLSFSIRLTCHLWASHKNFLLTKEYWRSKF